MSTLLGRVADGEFGGDGVGVGKDAEFIEILELSYKLLQQDVLLISVTDTGEPAIWICLSPLSFVRRKSWCLFQSCRL
jgi:hypothetical protein